MRREAFHATAVPTAFIDYAVRPQSSGEYRSAADRTTQLVIRLFQSNVQILSIPSGGLRRKASEQNRIVEPRLPKTVARF